MLKDTKNRFFQARSIDVSNTPTIWKETIGGKADRFDVFRFNVTNRSSFNATLKGLKANADLALFNGQRQTLSQSRKPGNRTEQINVNELEPGLYFLRVKGSQQTRTRYNLTLSTGPVTRLIPGQNGSVNPPVVKPSVEDNTAPSLFSNGLSINRGGAALITNQSLKATDAQQSAGQLTYTVTNLPKSGKLFLNGSLLNAGSTFTQADLDSNRVSYQQTPAKTIASGQSIDPTSLKTSGANAVWAAQDSSGDSEIFFFNGSSVKQITNNNVADSKPQIAGGNVVWQSGTGAASEIYLYKGSTGQTLRLTNDSHADTSAQISDSHIVWQKRSGGQSNVQFYSLSNATTGTLGNSSSNDDNQPLLSDNKVAFVRNGAGGNGIYFGNLSNGTVTQASQNAASYTDTLKGISGSTVVWERRYTATGDTDILYNSNPSSPVSARNINSSSVFNDTNAIISGNSIAFIRNQTNGNAADGIYLFNLSSGTEQQLTGSLPSTAQLTGISGSDIVGQSIVPGQVKTFVYRAGTLTQLEGGAAQEGAASISGSNVMWLGGSSLSNPNQVFMYDSATRNDSIGFSVSDGGLSTNGTLDITIA